MYSEPWATIVLAGACVTFVVGVVILISVFYLSDRMGK